MRVALIAAVITAAIGAAAAAQAPQFQPAAKLAAPPAPAGDVRPGVIAFSGENHIIGLSAGGGESLSTRVSFWRAVYSPVGTGRVCFVTADLTGDGPSKDDLRMAYADNEQLESYLAADIMPVLEPSPSAGPMHWTRATFSQSGDTRTEWRETIRADATVIELVWRQFLRPFLIDKPMGDPKMPYGITSMFLPARTADVIVNGVRVAGSAHPRLRGATPSSSAFLAFSETWLR